GAFFARWSTAVEMPPSQILREHRLVAQKKTAHGAPWTKEDVRELRAHSKARTPLPEIAKKMKRTERALRRKAGILGISAITAELCFRGSHVAGYSRLIATTRRTRRSPKSGRPVLQLIVRLSRLRIPPVIE